MTFVTPQALWLLLAIPVLAAAYVWLLRRRKRFVLRYSDLGLVREALGPEQRFRRHVPPILFMLGLAAILLAVARPTALITLPTAQRTVVMAIDVSLSMRASDVEPNRLAAAQTAAKAFVQRQPDDVRIGIVTFAGAAQLVQRPTRNKEDLVAAIDRFTLQRHTAIGSGILVSLAALFPEDDFDLEKAVLGGQSTREIARSRALDAKASGKRREQPAAVPPGSFTSGAIVVLTDGRRTTGPDPLQMAGLAASRGVRIFTVGFGQAQGGRADIDGYSMYMAFDETSLKAIAEATRGDYFHASTGEDLVKVYDALSARFELERERTEVTALASALGAVLALAGCALSMAWFGRVA